MTELTGISQDATRFQSLSENGDAAAIVSQNSPSLYEAAVRQSYLDKLPTDENASTGPQLRSNNTGGGSDLGDIYDRFRLTSDSFEVGMTEIFSVLHEAGVSLRKSMKDVRAAEREVQQSQLQEAADKLKNAATFAMVSGIVGGSMQAVGGAVSIGGAAASAKGVFGGKTPTTADVNDVLDINTTPKANDVAKLPIETRIQLAQQMSAKWTGSSQVIAGAGQAASAVFDAQAKFQESQKAELDAKATKSQQQVDDSNQLVQDLAEMVRDVRAKLSELENANNETIRKTLQV